LHPGWLAPALMAAALAALQLPLAYASGTRLADRRLGVLLGLRIAAAWMGLVRARRVLVHESRPHRACWRRCIAWFARSRRRARAGGCWPALQRRWRSMRTRRPRGWPRSSWSFAIARPGPVAHVVRDRVAAIALALAGLVLPFAPVLAAPQALVATVSATAAANLDVANLARLPELFVSIVWSGPYAIFGAAVWP
jgi:hypothetical protein